MNEERAKTLTDVLLSIKAVCDDLLTIIAKTQLKQQPPESLQDLQRLIPQDLQPLLTFEETAEVYVIKPKAYLGTENFVKIADVIRSLGGQYISAGKESRFEVPRAKP